MSDHSKGIPEIKGSPTAAFVGDCRQLSSAYYMVDEVIPVRYKPSNALS